MRKFCSKWVLCLLTVDQKQCVNISECCLQLFQHNKKKSKMQTSAGNVLASVFWDVQGILFIDYLEKGKTIHSKYYIALLVNLKEEIAKKRPQMKKKVLFHQDNVLYHKSITTIAKPHELHFKLLPHPPYSPDLAPSNYWLFADLKRMLQGKI